MTFRMRTSAARLPVALGAEAVAVGHQALHGDPGQLAQPAEVLEVGREGVEPARPPGRTAGPTSMRGGVAQGLVPRAARGELGHDRVAGLVLGHDGVDRGRGRRPSTAATGR